MLKFNPVLKDQFKQGHNISFYFKNITKLSKTNTHYTEYTVQSSVLQ